MIFVSSCYNFKIFLFKKYLCRKIGTFNVFKKYNSHGNRKKAAQNGKQNVIILKKGKPDPKSDRFVKDEQFCSYESYKKNWGETFWKLNQFKMF
jgi:hypothetical protein